MSTYDTKTKQWDAPAVNHDDIRTAIGKNAKVTTTSDGLIIFDEVLTEYEKLAVENLLKNKRV